ncbi:alpha/beta fold hydrolase [Rhizobium skierniewicense]|uniref:alpha/beta fold hydrolase n=1 Tax=Rhizobium skierniewicense TaxID=984260 RepID=UPI0015743BA0|nr:alpha/beta fold hydrolase [Rhizobium skierniewicense]NTF33062.1 alpha/beta fold hydrolase [Rhizobium skierniewicense]
MHDKYIAVDGVRIRYRDTGGAGTPILLTHGIGGSLEMFLKQLETMGGSFRLIAWDLPGHGLSDLGDQPYEPGKFSVFAWRFLDALDIDTVILVGNSLGGLISLRMADARPERVGGLLLASSAGFARNTPLAFRLMTLPILGDLMTRPSPMAIAQQLKAIFHDPAVVSDSIRTVVSRNVYKPGGAKAFVKTLRLMSWLGAQHPQLIRTSRAILQKLSQPIVFLHGREDAVLPCSHSIEAVKLAKNGQLIVLESCGHTPQFERPDAFNQILIDLVEQADSHVHG